MKTTLKFHERDAKTVIPSNLNQLTDRGLVKLYVKGTDECLAILLERHKAILFASIFKLVKDRALAEDFFQETFFKVIRSLKTGMYNEEDKFLPWIIRIARNMIIDHYRRIARLKTVSTIRNADGEREDIFNVLDIGEKPISSHMEKRQSHRQIRHLIKRLPDEQRKILIMREYFDMSFNEICALTKMNLNTALGRMRYAMISLKKMADEEKIIR